MTGGAASELGWGGARLVVQGMEPGQEVPLDWLARHLAHPDNFLHVVVIV